MEKMESEEEIMEYTGILEIIAVLLVAVVFSFLVVWRESDERQ